MNMSERVIAEVAISYKDGTSRDIIMEGKPLDEIGECKKGTIILLLEESGNNLTGIFTGVTEDEDDEWICMTALEDPTNILAFPKYGLEEYYFEEIDEMPKGESEIIQNFEE